MEYVTEYLTISINIIYVSTKRKKNGRQDVVLLKRIYDDEDKLQI